MPSCVGPWERKCGAIREQSRVPELMYPWNTRQRPGPRVCFFGHHHTRVDAVVFGVRCIGLNKVTMPRNLVAIDMEAGKQDWSLLGEFTQR